MYQTFSISEMANDYGVTARTIRHYEELGLLSPLRKGTQRIFDNRDYVRLSLILRGKRIGFSLPEIKEIINMYDLPEGEQKQTSFLIDKVHERRQMLITRQDDIEKMLAELDKIELRLQNN